MWLLAGPIKSNWPNVRTWSVFQYPVTYMQLMSRRLQRRMSKGKTSITKWCKPPPQHLMMTYQDHPHLQPCRHHQKMKNTHGNLKLNNNQMHRRSQQRYLKHTYNPHYLIIATYIKLHSSTNSYQLYYLYLVICCQPVRQ